MHSHRCQRPPTHARNAGWTHQTLHPAIHGGLLARRDLPDRMATLAAHAIGLIDILVVTLYPFEQTLASGASRGKSSSKSILAGLR